MSAVAKTSAGYDKLLEEIKNASVMKKLDIIENIVRELIKHLPKPIEVGDNVLLCKSDFIVISEDSKGDDKDNVVFKIMNSDKSWLSTNARLNYLCDAVELAHSYLKTSKVEKTAIVFNGSHYTILFALKG